MSKSNSIFEPALLLELIFLARQSQAEQRKADGHKWDLAERVNSEYPEYMYMFPTKLDYFAAMSQAINTQLSIGAFSESGQTLRFYCELQATLGNIPNIKRLLEASSIDHLRRAKRLAADNKIITDSGQLAGADYAIAKAIENKWSAEDMEQHFDPAEPPDPYKQFKTVLSSLLDPFTYSWISDAEVISKLICKAREYEDIKNDYLKKKGLVE